MSIFLLKIIALITMFTDHLAIAAHGVIPIWMYYVMRGFGRLAFPIFAFCIVQGFIHTSSVKKYIIRMFAAALISEVPFNMLNYGSFFSGTGCNIMFSFLISLIVLWGISRIKERNVMGILAVLAIVIIGAFAAWEIKSDYSFRCVILVAAMYITRFDKKTMLIASAVILLSDVNLIGLCALFALIPIAMYNGKRGKSLKYLFYAFYPLHMLILGFFVMR